MSKQKIEIIKEKLLKKNKFERDYSLFSKEKLSSKPNSYKSHKFYFSPDIKPKFLSPEEEIYPTKYQKKKFDIDGFSKIYKETNSSKFSRPKPIKILNTSSYLKLKVKGRNEDDFKDFEGTSNNESSNNRYNNSNLFNNNNSNQSNYKSSFLTGVGNNVIINKTKKSYKY